MSADERRTERAPHRRTPDKNKAARAELRAGGPAWTSLGGDPARDLLNDKMETRLFERVPVSGVHIADVFDAGLLYVFGGHCPALRDTSVSGSMAFGA